MINLDNDPLKRYFLSFNYIYMNYDKILTIAITGSCGKTSTTLYIYHFLKKKNMNVCYIGTHKILYNDEEITTKNTTLEIDKLTYYFKKHNIFPKIIVMEVSSHGINQARINNFKFDYIGLSNLGHEHLDFHLNVANYHQVKKAFLLSSIYAKKIFVPISYKKMINGKKIHYYKVIEKYFTSFECLKYDYQNLYLAFLILKSLNYRKKDILSTLKTIHLNNGRGEIIKHNNRKIIIDYAHHVESFETILNDSNYNKVVIFGCGGNRDVSKRPIMGKIALKYCKYVIVTKDNSRNENINKIIQDITLKDHRFIVILNRGEAIKYAIDNFKDLDIYILGKADENYIEENKTMIPFNDKNFVLDYINNK